MSKSILRPVDVGQIAGRCDSQEEEELLRAETDTRQGRMKLDVCVTDSNNVPGGN